MRAKKKSSFLEILMWVFLITFFTDGFVGGPIFYLFTDIFNIAFDVISAVFFLFIFLVICLIVGSAIVSKKQEKELENVSTSDFLSRLSGYENDRIDIDDEVYLLITDKNNITLETIDVFIRDEYVGNLAEYENVFPLQYNKLLVFLNKRFKKVKTKKKKKSKKEEVVQTVEEVKENIVKTGSSYFISRFTDLRMQLDNQQVISLCDETIDYLKQIKKIEDEFGDSKNKTRKIYEYYLPMYADILANYDRLHDNLPESEEFKESEEKVLKTASLINSALKAMTSSLVEDYYTNLNVDMKTLESVLKKDGLVKDNNVMKDEVK